MEISAFSARNLPFVVDAIFDFPADPEEGLRKLLEVSEADAKSLFDAARLLGIIDANDQLGELASVIRTASVVERREILRFYVERFEPYTYWKTRIDQGFDALEAARLVRQRFSLEQSPAEIRDRFIDLGMYCGSITESESTFNVTKGSSPPLGSLISSVLNREQSVAETLAEYLSSPVWEALPGQVRDHLVAALSKLSGSDPPSEVVREAGLAMDKYMEDLGNSLGAGYTGKTMGQSAKKLQDDGFLRSKQKGYTEYGTLLRNAAEHPDTDADLQGGSWSIGGRSSMTYLRVVLDFIRSAAAVVNGRHEL